MMITHPVACYDVGNQTAESSKQQRSRYGPLRNTGL